MIYHPKTVFTDASSAILLYKAYLFDALMDAWQVVMAPSVFKEITKTGYPGASYFKSLGEKTHYRSGKILIHEPTAAQPIEKKFISMGKGEKETIQIFCNLAGFCLSGQLKDSEPRMAFKKTGAFILVDDGRAARFCHARQIPFINALLVPKVFWYSSLMDKKEFLEKTDCLCELGRYSKTIMEMAQTFSKEDLNYFIRDKFPGGLII